jgi:hypothetical protein
MKIGRHLLAIDQDDSPEVAGACVTARALDILRGVAGSARRDPKRQAGQADASDNVTGSGL